MKWLNKILNRKPRSIEGDRLDEEARHLKRIQEIITLTDEVHRSLENVIKRRIQKTEAPTQDAFQTQKERARNYFDSLR